MYTPKLSEALVRQLYLLKTKLKIPMTKLLDRAVQEYLTNNQLNMEDKADDSGNQLSRRIAS